MTNAVRWHEVAEAPEGGEQGAEYKEVQSETTMQVDLVVPPWFVLGPKVVEKTGTSIMSSVLGTMIPRFLRQLRADYEKWAAGDDSREPVGRLDVPEDDSRA